MTTAERMRIARARALLERVEPEEGTEDWSLLANATTALDMILGRNPPKESK